MEGSQSGEVFNSFNLNPQLFINEVLNAVDDTIDGAFDYYEQEALSQLGKRGSDGSEELSRGVSSLRHVIKTVLDKRLDTWEKYCLQHCFVVPEGFSLPKAEESSSNSLLLKDELCDTELDSQLYSLRQKVVTVGKESAELYRELCALEKQSILNRSCAGSITEALQLFEQNSLTNMFQEMVEAASKLRTKMEAMKNKRREGMEQMKGERVYSLNKRQLVMHQKRISASLEELQGVVDDVKKM